MPSQGNSCCILLNATAVQSNKNRQDSNTVAQQLHSYLLSLGGETCSGSPWDRIHASGTADKACNCAWRPLPLLLARLPLGLRSHPAAADGPWLTHQTMSLPLLLRLHLLVRLEFLRPLLLLPLLVVVMCWPAANPSDGRHPPRLSMTLSRLHLLFQVLLQMPLPMLLLQLPPWPSLLPLPLVQGQVPSLTPCPSCEVPANNRPIIISLSVAMLQPSHHHDRMLHGPSHPSHHPQQTQLAAESETCHTTTVHSVLLSPVQYTRLAANYAKYN